MRKQILITRHFPLLLVQKIEELDLSPTLREKTYRTYRLIVCKHEDIKKRCHDKHNKIAFVNIHNSIFRKEICSNGDAIKCINHLIDIEAIECDERYSPDEESLGYRNIIPECILVPIEFKKKPTHKFFKRGYFENDFNQTDTEWHEQFIYSLNVNWKIVSEVFAKYKGEYSIERQMYLEDVLSLIDNGAPCHFIIDEFGYRLYSRLTNLNKEFRQCLMIGDEYVYALDVKNSIPAHLGVLVDDPSRFEHIIEPIIHDFYERVSVHTDNYSEIARNGKIYEAMPYNNRKTAKKLTMSYIFGEGDHGQYPLNGVGIYCKEKFPNTHTVLELMKRGNFKNCAKILQRIESYFMLNIVVPAMMKAGINTTTIHDAILIKYSDIERAQQVFNEIFKDYPRIVLDIARVEEKSKLKGNK